MAFEARLSDDTTHFLFNFAFLCDFFFFFLQTFLLEKTRVASHPEGEQNFNVLYQLIAGADEALRYDYTLVYLHTNTHHYTIICCANKLSVCLYVCVLINAIVYITCGLYKHFMCKGKINAIVDCFDCF